MCGIIWTNSPWTSPYSIIFTVSRSISIQSILNHIEPISIFVPGVSWKIPVCTQEIVRVVDHVLSQSLGDLCACLIMDGEGCNQPIKKMIHGLADPTMLRKMQNLEFFSKLEYTPIPLDWPKLPMQIATIEGEPFFGIIGPAHTMKNAAGQLQSHIRTLYYGNIFADVSGALAHSLPWPAFQRRDAMSDRLCALLSAPHFLLTPTATSFASKKGDEWDD